MINYHFCLEKLASLAARYRWDHREAGVDVHRGQMEVIASVHVNDGSLVQSG